MAYQNKRRPSAGGRKFGASRPRRRAAKKEGIHPSKFIKEARPTEKVEYVAKHTFRDFDIMPLLGKNIAKKGFTTPSPIQDQSIPLGLEGRDVIGLADTGTGKTIAFAIPVLQKLLINKSSKAIVLAPTRELAQQILEECQILLRGSKVQWALLIGGTSMGPQLRDLSRTPNLVIGTPGRIKDHIERKKLDLSTFDTVVLDEVDRMLDMGFVNDMRAILTKIPSRRQSFFFSATMEDSVKKLITEFSHDAVTVSVKSGDTSENVEQDVIRFSKPEEKMEKLHDVLTENKEGKVLIFDRTKRGVDRLNKNLVAKGFRSDSIHGDKSQGQRQKALLGFKRNKTRILVATDVAARGIDVKDITHVINYCPPESYDDYVHRIGRAGRAGRKGHAFTFVEERAQTKAPTKRWNRNR